MNKSKGLNHNEKHPYFEWVVISIFLIILASGIYLIRPSFKPQNEFNSPSFDPTKETENRIIEAPENIVTKVPEKLIIKPPQNKAQSSSLPVAEIIKNTDTTIIESTPVKDTDAILKKPVPVNPTPKTHYITISKDTLWKISEINYGSPFFWPVIYYHNIKKLTNPDKIEIGVNLELPLFNNIFKNLSPDEKPIVSESYYQVYLIYKELGKTDSEDYLILSKDF